MLQSRERAQPSSHDLPDFTGQQRSGFEAHPARILEPPTVHRLLQSALLLKETEHLQGEEWVAGTSLIEDVPEPLRAQPLEPFLQKSSRLRCRQALEGMHRDGERLVVIEIDEPAGQRRVATHLLLAIRRNDDDAAQLW